MWMCLGEELAEMWASLALLQPSAEDVAFQRYVCFLAYKRAWHARTGKGCRKKPDGPAKARLAARARELYAKKLQRPVRTYKRGKT